MTQAIPIIYVVIGLPIRNKDILVFGKGILSALTNNTRFPSPSPTLAVFSADLDAFDQAETVVASRGASAATQRDAKKTKVVQDIRHLRDYVQGVAETLTSDAIAAVESAGFRVRKASTRRKPELAVVDGATSGSVALRAKSPASSAFYYFEFSPDGKTWTSVPEGMKASTAVAGLAQGQTYSFRFRTLTRAGASSYSQVVTHFVR
jgi:hypothetical protein